MLNDHDPLQISSLLHITLYIYLQRLSPISFLFPQMLQILLYQHGWELSAPSLETVGNGWMAPIIV